MLTIYHRFMIRCLFDLMITFGCFWLSMASCNWFILWTELTLGVITCVGWKWCKRLWMLIWLKLNYSMELWRVCAKQGFITSCLQSTLQSTDFQLKSSRFLPSIVSVSKTSTCKCSYKTTKFNSPNIHTSSRRSSSQSKTSQELSSFTQLSKTSTHSYGRSRCYVRRSRSQAWS